MTTASPVLDALTLNRYHLKVKGCTAPLDVESFQGREGLSTRYRYDVVLTSADKDIDPSVMLMKNVTFIMQTLPQAAFRRTIVPEVQRTVYGVITRFSRLSVSADEATYTLSLPHHATTDPATACPSEGEYLYRAGRCKCPVSALYLRQHG